MDLFEKFAGSSEKLLLARESNSYFFFRALESGQDTEVTVGGQRLIMAGSNSYLGLTTHPRVKEAAIRAVERYGTGCAGSRVLNGNLVIHEELEERLARFFRKEAAVVFASGYQTNLGAISALVGRQDTVVIDQYDHASIIDGARLSFGKLKKFRHNDIDSLDKVLSEANPEGGCLVVVDGVFSMEGDIADLASITKVSRKHGARLMVDDAHGIGVLGAGGRGTAEHFDLEGEVDLIMGTYSKSLAAIGGFVAGPADVITYIRHFARSILFSAGLAPPLAAAVIAALDVIDEEPELRVRLWKNTHKMMQGFSEMGYDIGDSRTPIIPIILKDSAKVHMMCSLLFERGVFVNPVVSPAVPPGRELLRTSYMATHTDEQLDRILEAFRSAGREAGII